jgi:hypothetical protein
MPIFLGPRNTRRKVRDIQRVPQDVARRRRDVENIMRRMGTPVLHKHRYNDQDFKEGLCEKSPVYDDIYEQTRSRDPISHGIGYVSVEKSDDEWYDSSGTIVKSRLSPGPGWIKAPRYRGYGPSTLTYIIEPDASEDFFRSTPGGPIFQVMEAQAIAPWWPNINDNDILIQVVLDAQNNVVETSERWEVKGNVNSITIRGTDRRGRKETQEYFGNNHVMNQRFSINLVPHTDEIYNVETDR